MSLCSYLTLTLLGRGTSVDCAKPRKRSDFDLHFLQNEIEQGKRENQRGRDTVTVMLFVGLVGIVVWTQ